jgi:hypothetical protein
MKSKMIIGLLLVTHYLMAQTHSETITRELAFEKKSADNALIIANINGGVKVEGYAGDKIMVEVTKTIRAKTQARLDQGKQEVKLGVIDRADTLILFVDGLCSSFGRNPRSRGHNGGWNYQWADCGRNCEEPYDYTMNFTVKVPAAVHLLVSTVNDGNISVAETTGAVIANNVNGSIKLVNIMREADARTVNGDVDIEYARNPQSSCRFYTLNGDINAWFQKGLSASLSFKSFNGNFYTNIDKLESLPVMVEKKDTENGVKYKVNGNRFKAGEQFKGGAGEVNLDFETFNGDVILKERSQK